MTIDKETHRRAAVAFLRDFLENELDTRKSSMLPTEDEKDQDYISSAEQAVVALEVIVEGI